jgi:hypothetical protein|tara:strand:- start:8428 stop:9684 length:1257 start_codon:yes stop_codon:yes gene_type:complete
MIPLRRSIWLGVAIALPLAACNSPRHLEPFADYAPVQQLSVSTDVIDPANPAFDDFLGHGWERRAEGAVAADGRAIDDRWASFRFYVAMEGAATLEIEANPGPIDPPGEQVLSLEVNDRHMGRVTLERGWSTYTIPLPADGLESGWNRAELRFRRLARPPGRPDLRRLAGRVRRLRLRSALNRPVWTDRPPAIRAVSESADAGRIEMPTDSIVDVYVELGPNAQLVGAVDAIPAEGAPRSARLRAAVELLDAEGRSQTLFERAFASQGEDEGERFEIDLDRWKDSIVRFRLRSWGDANGVIRWHDLGVEAPGSAGTVSVDRSGRLRSPPRSGRLGRPNVVVILVDAGRADAFDGAVPIGRPRRSRAWLRTARDSRRPGRRRAGPVRAFRAWRRGGTPKRPAPTTGARRFRCPCRRSPS